MTNEEIKETMKTIELENVVTTASKIKIGSAFIATVSFLGRIPKIPIIGSAICFASCATEEIAKVLIEDRDKKVNTVASSATAYTDEEDEDVSGTLENEDDTIDTDIENSVDEEVDESEYVVFDEDSDVFEENRCVKCSEENGALFAQCITSDRPLCEDGEPCDEVVIENEGIDTTVFDEPDTLIDKIAWSAETSASESENNK